MMYNCKKDLNNIIDNSKQENIKLNVYRSRFIKAADIEPNSFTKPPIEQGEKGLPFSLGSSQLHPRSVGVTLIGGLQLQNLPDENVTPKKPVPIFYQLVTPTAKMIAADQLMTTEGDDFTPIHGNATKGFSEFQGNLRQPKDSDLKVEGGKHGPLMTLDDQPNEDKMDVENYDDFEDSLDVDENKKDQESSWVRAF